VYAQPRLVALLDRASHHTAPSKSASATMAMRRWRSDQPAMRRQTLTHPDCHTPVADDAALSLPSARPIPPPTARSPDGPGVFWGGCAYASRLSPFGLMHTTISRSLARLTGLVLAAVALGGCGGSGAGPAVGHVSTAPGAAAVDLGPGVVTVAQLRTPAGKPFTLTLQRISFQGREYICLDANTKQATIGGSPPKSSSGDCVAPLPLSLARQRGIIYVRGDPAGCSPRPYQLVWGLARPDVAVALSSPHGERPAIRRSVPAALRTQADLFYVWAAATPNRLVARDHAGKARRIIPIHDTTRYFCR
jgi:hypothetical protein